MILRICESTCESKGKLRYTDRTQITLPNRFWSFFTRRTDHLVEK